MKKKVSLKWKLARTFLLFTVFLLCLLWVFQIALLKPMYQSYKRKTIENISSGIIQQLNRSNINDVIYDYSVRNDLCIRLMNSNQDVIAGNVGCVLYRLSNQDILYQGELAQSNGGRYFYQSNQNANYQTMILTSVVSANNQQSVLLVSAVVNPVDPTIQTLRMQIGYITVIVIFVVLLLVIWLNHTIVRPLDLITSEAEHLARGYYNPTFSADDYIEADKLNQTLISAAKEIHKADQAKKDLLANVSHDLRTPLTMISGYGEMMIDLPGEKTDENIQVIIDESKRLTNLVNDLLDYSKLEEQKIELHQEKFDISQVLKDVAKKYEIYQLKEGYQFHLEIPEGIIVYGDSFRIQQVLNNFIINAINYSDKKKQIDISMTLEEDNNVRISVRDYGIGIEQSKLKDIWDRYYKVDKQHVRFSHGSGIGLAIAKQILELHQVAFGVTSQVDVGSTFYFIMKRCK